MQPRMLGFARPPARCRPRPAQKPPALESKINLCSPIRAAPGKPFRFRCEIPIAGGQPLYLLAAAGKNLHLDNLRASRSLRSAEDQISRASNLRPQLWLLANREEENADNAQISRYSLARLSLILAARAPNSRFQGCKSFRKRARLRPQKVLLTNCRSSPAE